MWRVDDLDPVTARTLTDVNGFAFFVSFATLAMLVGPAALVALRTGLLPRALAVVGLVLAGAQLVTMAVGPTGPAVVPFLLVRALARRRQRRADPSRPRPEGGARGRSGGDRGGLNAPETRAPRRGARAAHHRPGAPARSQTSSPCATASRPYAVLVVCPSASIE